MVPGHRSEGMAGSILWEDKELSGLLPRAFCTSGCYGCLFLFLFLSLRQGLNVFFYVVLPGLELAS